MKPTPYALAASTRGEPHGPDLRDAFDRQEQTDVDELARIERFGGPFRLDGRDWLVEIYQELLDAFGYAVAHLCDLGDKARDRDWAMVINLRDRCDAIRRRLERRDGR